MKYTNNHDLPSPFVRYDRMDPHSTGGAAWSVTGLMDSAQVVRLTREHEHEMTEDAADGILSLLGTAVHGVLEKAADPFDMIEERFHAELDGETFSGQCDRMVLLDGGVYRLEDYKVTSSSTLKFNPEGKDDWHKQVNIYAWLARKNGYDVTEGEILVVVRDWRKSAAAYDRTYPQQPIIRVKIPMWDDDEVEEYLKERIAAHTAEVVAPCTKEERWMGDTVYAVHKLQAGGALSKRAVNGGLHDTMEAAEEFMFAGGILGQVEVRLGHPNRCADWCAASPWCKQFQDEQG
jgi:hypothetical protein